VADKQGDPGQQGKDEAKDAAAQGAPPPQSAPPKGDEKPPAVAPEVQAKLDRLAKLEKDEAEREKAKLSEQERVAQEKAELARERYHLQLERAGFPAELVSHMAVPAKGDPEKVAAEVGKLFEKAVKAEADRRAKSDGDAGGGKPPIGKPHGAAGANGSKTSPGGSEEPTKSPFRPLSERAVQLGGTRGAGR